jgi:hypothetical protein
MIAKVKSREHAKRTKVSVKGHKTPTLVVGERYTYRKNRDEKRHKKAYTKKNRVDHLKAPTKGSSSEFPKDERRNREAKKP